MRCLHILSSTSGRIPCRTLEALPRLAPSTSGPVLVRAAAQLNAVSRASASASLRPKQLGTSAGGVAAAAMPGEDITYLCVL